MCAKHFPCLSEGHPTDEVAFDHVSQPAGKRCVARGRRGRIRSNSHQVGKGNKGVLSSELLPWSCKRTVRSAGLN